MTKLTLTYFIPFLIKIEIVLVSVQGLFKILFQAPSAPSAAGSYFRTSLELLEGYYKVFFIIYRIKIGRAHV